MGILATVLLGAGATLGCAAKSASTAPATTATTAGSPDEEEAAAGVFEHHRYHHHGGVTLFIAMSLDTLGVTPEQRAAVEKIRTDLHAKMQPASAAEQDLATVLASGVNAGSFDSAKVDAAVARVSAAAATVHDASIDALNQLHAVLTPPERAALVDKVEAHWAVWQKANIDESGQAKSDSSHLSALGSELALTPDQVEKIRVSLGQGMKALPPLDPQEIATHIHAFGEAFRSETFDAKLITTANNANAHMAGWGASHMARFVEAASPVLTAEQRVKLEHRLRDHAGHNPSATQVTP